jgi:hypothetical protein
MFTYEGELTSHQHAVSPKGPLRYALTCRYVRPEMMSNAAEAQDALMKGSLPSGSEKYNYDGDMNATAVVCSADTVDKFINKIIAGLKTGGLTDSQVREISDRVASIFTPSNAEPEH